MSQEWVGRGAPGIGGRGRDTPATACAKTHPIGNVRIGGATVVKIVVGETHM